jgi:predicted permease
LNPGKALVVSQIALSLVLLTGAGLLLRTFWTLSTMDPGFERSGVLLAEVVLPRTDSGAENYGRAFADMLERVRAIPGVQSASGSQITPISFSSWNDIIHVDGYAPPPGEESLVMANEVSEGYFSTLRTPLIAGRDFTRDDTPSSPKVAIITATLAQKYFGGLDAVGKELHFDVKHEPGPPVQVIGIVKDAKYRSMREDLLPTAYIALSQDTAPGPYLNLEILAPAGAGTMVAPLRRLAAEIDPAISLSFTTLESQVDESLSRERLMATLSGFFGAVALILAMIGLYGVMAYNVAQRRNEIGIRIALGSARSRVLTLVLGEAGVLVTIGIVIGLVFAYATMRLMKAFVFGVNATDPAVFITASLILAAVAIAAGALPAWRAARLDPMSALREE